MNFWIRVRKIWEKPINPPRVLISVMTMDGIEDVEIVTNITNYEILYTLTKKEIAKED